MSKKTVEQQFDDSVEATEFMYELQSMLNDPRLLNWAKETDENYTSNGSSFAEVVKRVVDVYDSFIESIEQLDE